MQRLGVLVLAAVTAACAAKAPVATYGPPPDRTYDASVDEVWDVVIEAFTDLEMPIENMERTSGFIRSDYLDVKALGTEYVDCGKIWLGAVRGGWVTPVNIRGAPAPIRVTVLVRETNGGTSLRLRERGGNGTYEGDKSYRCEPTGKIGDRLFAVVEEGLRG